MFYSLTYIVFISKTNQLPACTAPKERLSSQTCIPPLPCLQQVQSASYPHINFNIILPGTVSRKLPSLIMSIQNSAIISHLLLHEHVPPVSCSYLKDHSNTTIRSQIQLPLVTKYYIIFCDRGVQRCQVTTAVQRRW